MAQIIHKELSYKITGIIFSVYNRLGYGYREKIYKDAIEIELKNEKIQYQRELIVPLYYKGNIIGKYVFDFVVENKVILEIKVSNNFWVKDIQQIFSYLTASELRLGILVLITKKGVKSKRIVH